MTSSKASDWRPIETAPKSGPLMLWNGKDVVMGQFEDCFGYRGHSRSQWADFTRPDGDHGGWYACNPQPTHWMPLPEPPQS